MQCYLKATVIFSPAMVSEISFISCDSPPKGFNIDLEQRKANPETITAHNIKRINKSLCKVSTELKASATSISESSAQKGVRAHQ